MAATINNQDEDSVPEPNNSTCTEGSTNKDKLSAGHIVVSYVQELGKPQEDLHQISGSDILQRSTTIKQLLARPKDQDP